MTKFPFKLRIISCVVLASVSSQPLHAKGFTFSPEVLAQIAFEDNVFRLADEENAADIIGTDSRSDTIIDLGAGFDAEYETDVNTVEVNADIYRSEYIDFSVLDFTGLDIDAKWNWNGNNRVQTELGYDFKRDQSNFNESNLAQGDLFNQNSAYFEVTGKATQKNDVYLRVAARTIDFEIRDQLENDVFDLALGVRRVSRLGNSIGFEISRSEGDFPNRLAFSDTLESLEDYTEDQATVKIDWRPSSKSRLRADIGFIDRQHNSQLSEFDVTDLVYDFRFSWDVGPRTELNAQLVREIRDTINVLTLFNEEDRFKIDAAWRVTSKLRVSSGVTFREIDFIQSGFVREDSATLFEAEVQYELNRRSLFGFTFRTRDRSSNEFDNEFDSNLALLSYRRKL